MSRPLPTGKKHGSEKILRRAPPARAPREPLRGTIGFVLELMEGLMPLFCCQEAGEPRVPSCPSTSTSSDVNRRAPTVDHADHDRLAAGPTDHGLRLLFTRSAPNVCLTARTRTGHAYGCRKTASPSRKGWAWHPKPGDGNRWASTFCPTKTRAGASFSRATSVAALVHAMLP